MGLPLVTERYIFQRSIVYAMGFVFLLWAIKAIEWGAASDFGVLGILPRTLSGTVGILTAPLVHGDFSHLLSNTTSLLLLLVALFYFYDKIALEVFLWIYLMTGLWVWIAARPAYHIGASGLVHGIVTFLFFSGLLRKDARSMAVALATMFLYGGMIYGIFPGNESVSWESHLLGAVAGTFCAFYFRKNIGSGLLPKVSAAPDLVTDSEPSLAFDKFSDTLENSEKGHIELRYEYVEKKEGDS
jgi:membrane associated rhomboid family serine protease